MCILPYIDPLDNPVILYSLYMAKLPENTFINPFIILHTYHINALGTLPIFLIPSKPLRLSICTALILDLSFFFPIIVLLPYLRAGIYKQYLMQETSTLLLQNLSIYQGPNSTYNFPLIHHLPVTLPHLYLIHPKHNKSI